MPFQGHRLVCDADMMPIGVTLGFGEAEIVGRLSEESAVVVGVAHRGSRRAGPTIANRRGSIARGAPRSTTIATPAGRPKRASCPQSCPWRNSPQQRNLEVTRKLNLTRGLIGERGGNRTHDPLIKSQMLYLLSYALAARPEGPAPRAYSLIGDGSTSMSAFNRAVRAARSRTKSSPA
jgi:hypothetical protein